jgi:amidase
MKKADFTLADAESIDIVERAVGDLRRLGATVVDPGPNGALFQGCVDRFVPKWLNQQFTPQWPAVFPAGADHNTTLVDLFFDTSKVPHTAAGRPSIRNIGGAGTDAGDARYNFNAYIRERGDSNIKSLTDLITKANFWTDPVLANRKASLENADRALTLATASALQSKHTMQTVVHQCFAEQDLDAVVYPSGNIPPAVLTAVQEPTVNDRGSNWTAISSRGFPALSVPAGFTTRVYDRGPDGQLLPPKAARLPVGVDFLTLPFRESTLFTIGAAYEAATRHRTPPPGFGPLDRR